jgi:hypothetical protein
MNSTIFWAITPCIPLKVNRRFGKTEQSSVFHLLSSWFLAQLDPEDEGDMFIRNIS